MNAGSLFTGIGGLDLGVNAAFGCKTAWMCEFDRHCRTVLERRFPGVPVYGDVHDIDGSAPRVDILHGGYPCQPFSVAGLRRGEDDPRHLWPQFARVARALRPRILVLENVAGHLRLGFDSVLADLAEMGYDCRWGVVRASDAGAPHQRARLFVVACGCGQAASDTNGRRREQRDPAVGRVPVAREDRAPAATDADGAGRQGVRAEPRETPPFRANDRNRASEYTGRALDWRDYGDAIRRWEHITGVPAPRPTDDRGRLMPEFVEWMMGFPAGWTEDVSRTQRLKMLGNAVVPAQAELAISLLLADISVREAA